MLAGSYLCNGQDKLMAIVEELGNQFEEYVPAKDLDKIMGLYAEDSRYLPDNNGMLVGLEAIRAYWAATFNLDIVGFEMTTVSAEGNPKLIYETGFGKSQIKVQEKIVPFKFKYVNVWRKEKDGYKLIIDTYNRDSPDEGS